MTNKNFIICPHCGNERLKPISFVTEWGYENFYQCKLCGVVFGETENDK